MDGGKKRKRPPQQSGLAFANDDDDDEPAPVPIRLANNKKARQELPVPPVPVFPSQLRAGTQDVEKHTNTMRQFRDGIMTSFATVLSSASVDAGKLIKYIALLSKKYPFLFATASEVPRFCTEVRPDNTSSEEIFEFMRFWIHGLFSLLFQEDMQSKSEAILTCILSVGELVSFGNPDLTRIVFGEISNAIRGEDVCLHQDDNRIRVFYKAENGKGRRIRIFTEALQVFLPNITYYSSLQKTEHVRNLVSLWGRLNGSALDVFSSSLLPNNSSLGRLLPAGESSFLGIMERTVFLLFASSLLPENVTSCRRLWLLLTNHSVSLKLFSQLLLYRLHVLVTSALSDAKYDELPSDTRKLIECLYSLLQKALLQANGGVLLQKQISIFQKTSRKGVENIPFLNFQNPLLEDAIFTQLRTSFNQMTPTRGNTQERKFHPKFQGVKDVKDVCLQPECSPLWQAVSSEMESQLHDLDLRSDLPILLRSLMISSSFIRLASHLNSQLVDLSSSKKGEFIPIYEFLNIRILTKWTDLAVKVLLELLQNPSTPPKEVESNYCLILDTIKAFDNGGFMQFDLPAEVSCKLVIMAGLPWLSSPNFLGCHKLLPLQHVADILFVLEPSVVKKHLSSLARGKCLLTLSCSFFLPWRSLILEIFVAVMDDNDFELNASIQMLRLIKKKAWIFRCLPISCMLLYLQRLFKKSSWESNPLLRNRLASALSVLPCLYFMSTRMGKENGQFGPIRTFKFLLSHCPLCDEADGNLGKLQRNNPSNEELDTELEDDNLTPTGLGNPGKKAMREVNLHKIPQRVLQCVLKLALPLVRSQFQVVQRKICALIKATRNHSLDYPPQFISEFAVMAAKSDAGVGLAVMENFAYFFKLNKTTPLFENSAMDTCRLEGISTFFNTLFYYLGNDSCASLTKAMVMLQGFTTMDADETMNVEVIKLCLRILAKSDSEIRNFLAQRLCMSLALRSNPPCLGWELLTRLRYELAPTVVELIKNEVMKISDDIEIQQEKVKSFISSFCIMGEFRTYMTFALHYFPVMMGDIVPYLYKDSKCKDILQFLANWISSTPQQLIQDGFPNFFRVMAVELAPEIMNNTMAQLETEWKLDTSFLVGNIQQMSMNELLSHIYDRKEKVLKNIAFLNRGSDPDPGPLPRSGAQELIGKFLMAFFVHADTKLHSRVESMTRKRRILQSFTFLLEYIGKSRVTANKSKIYATLNSLFSLGPEYVDLQFKAWKAFANNLESDAIPGIMPSILAAVTNLHQYLPSDVESLFLSYIHSRRNAESNNFAELYFLQDYTTDADVVGPIQEALKKLGCRTWVTVFSLFVRDAGNENSHIRSRAISKLLHTLRTEYAMVKNSMLDRQHPLVGNLLSSLLSAGRDADKQTLMRLAEAFGYLGAVDPYRYRNFNDEENRRRSQPVLTVDDAAFAAKFLNILVREFQESEDTTDFDYCSCLIQQLLRHYKIEGSVQDPVWRTMPFYAQEILTPLLTSKYRVERKIPIISYPSPLYQSRYGKDFDSWLSSWVTVMASSVQEEETIGKIFEFSKYIIPRNNRIASFLLPYIATYAMIHTEEGNYRVITEIQTILQRWVDQDKFKSCTQILTLKETQAVVADGDTQIPKTPKVWQDEDVMQYRCTQQVFAVLDHLFRTVRQAKRQAGLKKAQVPQGSKKRIKTSPCQNEKDTDKLSSGLKQIQLETLSQVAFYCEDFTRALFYWEQVLQEKPALLRERLNFLQQLYISLGDMDSVVGVSKVRRGEAPVNEIVCESFAEGKVEAGVQNLETMVNEDPEDLIATTGLLEAYLRLDEPRKAEMLLEGAVKKNSSWVVPLEEFQIEAATKLRDWKKLQKIVGDDTSLLQKRKTNSRKDTINWNKPIPKILCLIQSSDIETALQLLNDTRLQLMSPLVAASNDRNGYSRCYPYMVQLHILTEMEQVIRVIQESGENRFDTAKARAIISHWTDREQSLLKSQKWIDPILEVRKSLLEIMKQIANPQDSEVFNAAIRDCWLTAAQVETKSGNFTRAANCIVQARKCRDNSIQLCPRVVIQNAKLLSLKGEKKQALEILTTSIPQIFPEVNIWKLSSTSQHDHQQERKLCSQAMLLRAKLAVELQLLDIEKNINNFEECIAVFTSSEKNNFTLAGYYDRLFVSLEGANNDNAPRDRGKEAEYQEKIVKFYAQSLQYGCKYVYQSLPRLLTIWVDFAGIGYSNANANTKTKNGTASTTVEVEEQARPPNWSLIQKSMEECIRQLVKNVPAYVLLTAISQLVSRLCHPNLQCWTLLKEILCVIVRSHPHQALWMTMGMAKSNQRSRKTRCLEMYREVKKGNAPLSKMIDDYSKFGDKLMGLCVKQVDRHAQTFSLKKLYPDFVEFLTSSNFGDVLVPFHVFLNPAIPSNGRGHLSHDAFPQKFVYIEGTEDTVVMMNSQIRPKKVTLIGSDGKKYGILCKPNDDLRRDAKVMEFNTVVNWYLHRNPESKQRQLNVRVFAVSPLNEEHGILEWIPNLAGLRACILNIFKEKSIVMDMKEFRNLYQSTNPIEVSKARFQKAGLDKYPPVFSEWFITNFNDPQSWYKARQSFTRTTAVMSIVGFIFGLGDRHGENILVDSATGDTVHVDFNCIFNAGESFTVPERVPFRLTQNMVEAMGPLGVEGVFRRTCEITLAMFREHKDVFLSVLRPFVFDPLLDWTMKNQGDNKWSTAKPSKANLINIKNRIEGSARNCSSETNTPLSVEAFVAHLIDEATSIDNLCRMFYGWSAWL